MKRITAELLQDHNADADQVKTFRRLFPRGANVTLANVRKAYKAGLDIERIVRAAFEYLVRNR